MRILEPYKILNNVINILHTTLNIEVYSTFSSRKVDYPIKHEFLTVETYFGTESKTIITIKTYVPKSKGSKFCRELTEKVRNNIENKYIIIKEEKFYLPIEESERTLLVIKNK